MPETDTFCAKNGEFFLDRTAAGFGAAQSTVKLVFRTGGDRVGIKLPGVSLNISR